MTTPVPVAGRSVSNSIAFWLLVLAYLFGGLWAVFQLTSWMTGTTDVVVGQAYNVMIYPCDITFNKIDGAGKTVTETERVYDVVFVGANRQMMHQMVPMRFVRKVESIEAGQGRWVQIPDNYPIVEGIKYGTDGWKKEFQFNGTLQELSTPTTECRSR